MREAVDHSPDPGAAAAVFAAAGASHAGSVQTDNEDSWLIDEGFGLAMAADGVGGHGGGAVASRAAVNAIAEHLHAAARDSLRAASDGPDERVRRENLVRRAIAFAHDRLISMNRQNVVAQRQSGTTVAGVWAPWGGRSFATVFHVGDSRVYRLRDGRLEQLTRDHSAYERWVERGRIGAPPSQKYILQALGVSQKVKPDLVSFAPAPGDRLLICTDGVSNDVAAAELEPALAGAPGAGAGSRTLVDLALAHGGRDNLTAVVCDFGN